MKTIRVMQKVLITALVILIWNCTKEELNPSDSQLNGNGNPIDSIQGNTQADTINYFFSLLPEWDIPEVTAKADVILDSIEVHDADGDSTFTCSLIERNLVRTIKNFFSAGTNFGIIWPGALIQGNSIETGELKPINAKRSPITLTTDLALEQTSITLEEPNSVSAQQAIADFMIAAGEMPDASKNGAGTMNFQIEEASTFEQSMLAMGISGGFTEPQSTIGLDASLSVEVSRSSETHTVIAKFVQEMFTIRVADDLLPTPADFFADDVNLEDIVGMQEAGEISESNIPVYIESVTYGRLMLFSLESKNVESAERLAAALDASAADYASAGGNLDAEHEKIFKEKTTSLYTAGGTKGAANLAIKDLDWSKFFEEAPASTAVPISFVARTLSGKKIVGLVENTTFQKRDDCSLNEISEPSLPLYYEITVEWTSTEGTGACAVPAICTESAAVKLEREAIGKLLTVGNSWKRKFTIPGDADKQSDGFSITSAWSYAGTDQTSFTASALPEGVWNKSRPHVLTNFAGSVTLKFKITKNTVYK